MSASPRTPEQITAEITETRERLASTIDQLVVRASPKTIASREFGAVKSRFVGPDGSPNLRTIGITAGGVLGFVALVVLIRKVVR